MTKQAKSTLSLDKPSEKAVPSEYPVSVEQFCRELSSSDQRIELISGFLATEKAAKRLTDTRQNYQDRFTSFANSPVSG